MHKNSLGNKGEKLACDYLIKNGYKILERNWRFGRFEIDIIAQKNNLIVIVEVKTRSNDYFVAPQQTLKKKQIENILQAANHYITQKNLDSEVRLDIIGLIKNKNTFTLKHLKDAFYHF